jgi:hypothetical protein
MLFFRFIKHSHYGLYKTLTYTRLISVNKLEYIDYDHYTKKTHFYFDGYSVETEKYSLNELMEKLKEKYLVYPWFHFYIFV